MIIFDKFGDGQPKQNGASRALSAIGRETGGVHSLHSRRFRSLPAVAGVSIFFCPPRTSFIAAELKNPSQTVEGPSFRAISVANFESLTPISNRHRPKSRSYTKQITKPLLTGTTTGSSESFRRAIFDRNLRCQPSFLTETDPHSKLDVTSTKQTTELFLTETRIVLRRRAFDSTFPIHSGPPLRLVDTGVPVRCGGNFTRPPRISNRHGATNRNGRNSIKIKRRHFSNRGQNSFNCTTGFVVNSVHRSTV